MKLDLIIPTIVIAANTTFASLPAHAAASQSTAETLQKMVDTLLPTQATKPEDIDPSFSVPTESEEIDRKAIDFPTTEDAVTPTEETIVALANPAIANENCFSNTPATSIFPPASDSPEETPPSDEDPTAKDRDSPAFQSLNEFLQHLKDAEVRNEMWAT
jgi:hypothetical protein